MDISVEENSIQVNPARMETSNSVKHEKEKCFANNGFLKELESRVLKSPVFITAFINGNGRGRLGRSPWYVHINIYFTIPLS